MSSSKKKLNEDIRLKKDIFIIENFNNMFNKIKRVDEDDLTSIEGFKTSLEMSFYEINKKIESKISELRTQFDLNEDTIYKLENLMNETQRLTNYLDEIR
jgi:hypothetical protein